MFVTDELVYLELHKTGGTHIGSLLSNLFQGRQIGKHNRLTPDLYNKFVLGSVRDPWDWYVSLWAYGCSQRGSVYSSTTQKVNFSYYNRQLPKEMGRNWCSPSQYIRQIYADYLKPVQLWKSCYEDFECSDSFRKWLKLLLLQANKLDCREGYGFSPISKQYGLMTYRYFKLFTSLNQRIYQSAKYFSELKALQDVWNNYKVVNYIIKNENLEEDLLNAIAAAGIELKKSQKEYVLAGRNQKTNTSKRKPAAYYYDEETANLIAEKEAFIIKMHDYRSPLEALDRK